jgi:hypothetical protein
VLQNPQATPPFVDNASIQVRTTTSSQSAADGDAYRRAFR